jgi:hypothetical protein
MTATPQVLLGRLRATGPFPLTLDKAKTLVTGRVIELYCVAPDGRIFTPKVII